MPRATRGALVIAWLLCAALGLGLAGRGLEVPGLYYDEAIQAGPARDFVRGASRGAHAPGIESVSLGGRPFPWMTQAYMGALKSQLLIPSFALFGAGKRVLRATTLTWALLGVGLAMVFVWQLCGVATAFVAGLLLVTDPSLLFVARHDWGAASLAFGLRCGVLVCALAGWRSGHRRRWWLAAGLLAGLGLYNKVDFAGGLAALALALLAAAGRPLLRVVRRDPAAVCAAVLGVVLAAAPLAPSLRTVWRVSHAFGAASAGGSEEGAEKWLVLRSTLDGSYFERLMRAGGDFARLGDESTAGTDGLGAATALCGLGLGLLALRAALRGDPAARVPGFLVLAAGLTLAAVLATPHATRIHHFLALAPLPHALVALAATRVWGAARGLEGAGRALARGAVAAGILGLLAAGAREAERTLDFLRETRGRGLWSDAIDRFAASVDGDARREVVALDWGLAEPLLFLTEGPRIEEPVYGFRLVQMGGPAWRHTGTSDTIYGTWQAPFAIFGTQDKFLRALGRLPPDAVELVPWRDRSGDTVFLAARILRPHVLTYFGDFAIRLLPEAPGAGEPTGGSPAPAGVPGGSPPPTRPPAPATAPPPSWSFDASDQQMQQLIQYALDTTGCRIDQPDCPGLAEALRDGGDRLASYLIDQYRLAGPEHPAAQALLDLAASTRSQAALDYLGEQLMHPERAGSEGTRQAANALGHAPGAATTGIALRAWGRNPDDVTLKLALVDAVERTALSLPDRQADATQTLRLLSIDPTLTPELSGRIAQAQVCLQLGRGCPAP